MKTWLKVFYWALTLFMLYLVFEIIRKVLGGSLGFEELVIGLSLANLAYVVTLHNKLSEHLGWHKAQKS